METVQGQTAPQRSFIQLNIGDLVRVSQKVKEGSKERIQMFEGTVISKRKETDPSATFTVRKMASGVGVERIFPVYSPNITDIQVVKGFKVRRAKLFYLRDSIGKKYRLKEKPKVQTGDKSKSVKKEKTA